MPGKSKKKAAVAAANNKKQSAAAPAAAAPAAAEPEEVTSPTAEDAAATTTPAPAPVEAESAPAAAAAPAPVAAAAVAAEVKPAVVPAAVEAVAPTPAVVTAPAAAVVTPAPAPVVAAVAVTPAPAPAAKVVPPIQIDEKTHSIPVAPGAATPPIATVPANAPVLAPIAAAAPVKRTSVSGAPGGAPIGSAAPVAAVDAKTKAVVAPNAAAAPAAAGAAAAPAPKDGKDAGAAAAAAAAAARQAHLQSVADEKVRAHQAMIAKLAEDTARTEKLRREEKEKAWLLARKQKMIAQQTDRRNHINRERQAVIAAGEKEAAHWTKQETRFQLMMKRMKTGQKTSEELHAFLLKENKNLSLYTAGLASRGVFGTEETGTLRQAAIAEDLLCKKVSQYQTDYRERVFDDSVNQAALLSKHMTKRVADMHKAGSKIHRDINGQRTRTAAAWKQYEAVVADRQKAEMTDKPAKADPYLAMREYEVEQAVLKKTEAEYTKEMTLLFQELKVGDGRRIDAMKAILLDNLLAHKAVLEHSLKLTESAIATVKSIDREKDVAEFIRSADLIIPGADAKTPPISVFEVPPPTKDPLSVKRLFAEEVEKEGGLQRQGKILSSNWKPIHAVISKSGFFHYYPPTDEKDKATAAAIAAGGSAAAPELSIPLHDCIISTATAVDQFAFEIEQPNSNFFSLTGTPNKFYFRIDPAALPSPAAVLAEWLVALRRYSVPVYLPPPPPPGTAAAAGAGGVAATAAVAADKPAAAAGFSTTPIPPAGAAVKPPPPAHPPVAAAAPVAGAAVAAAGAEEHSPKNPLQSPMHK